MTSDFEFAKATGKCAVTERPFNEGESYFAVLIEEQDGFVRRDYSSEAWTGPPAGCYCFWRARVPVKSRKSAIAVDLNLLVHLFQRLEGDESPARQQFRFVLALLLMRKRLLRFESTRREGGDLEQWSMRLVSDQSLHQVVNPSLTEEQIGALNQQLTALLSGEVEAIAGIEEPSGAPEAADAVPATPPGSLADTP